MKIKTTLIALVLTATTFAALPLCAQTGESGKAQIELKLRQIELDVAMKQFEKISTQLAEASLQARLADYDGLPETQQKEQAEKAERKIRVLEDIKTNLRGEIMKMSADIEATRRDRPVAAPSLTQPAPGSPRVPPVLTPAPSANPPVAPRPVPPAPSPENSPRTF